MSNEKKYIPERVSWYPKHDNPYFDQGFEIFLTSDIDWDSDKPYGLFCGIKNGTKQEIFCRLDEVEMKFLCTRCKEEVYEGTKCCASNFSLFCNG